MGMQIMESLDDLPQTESYAYLLDMASCPELQDSTKNLAMKIYNLQFSAGQCLPADEFAVCDTEN